MYIQHISITFHILHPTLLPFPWAGWLSSIPSVRYSWERFISHIVFGKVYFIRKSSFYKYSYQRNNIVTYKAPWGFVKDTVQYVCSSIWKKWRRILYTYFIIIWFCYVGAKMISNGGEKFISSCEKNFILIVRKSSSPCWEKVHLQWWRKAGSLIVRKRLSSWWGKANLHNGENADLQWWRKVDLHWWEQLISNSG
jgi:hypothetical protein